MRRNKIRIVLTTNHQISKRLQERVINNLKKKTPNRLKYNLTSFRIVSDTSFDTS